MRPPTGVPVGQVIRPQARTLASDRDIGCVEIDYDELRGIESNELRLF
jgi:RecB family endonuclease NucS